MLSAVRSAGAYCGDGIVQSPEVCDPGSPASEAACPGRCIGTPNPQACQCASVSTDPRDYTAIADEQIRLGRDAGITGGGAVVRIAGGYLSLGSGASIAGEGQAVADRCRLLPTSSVGRLFCNEPLVIGDAHVNGGGPYALTTPVVVAPPPVPAGTPGSTDVVVGLGSTRYLSPGAYGNLIVSPGGTLILHGLNANSATGRFDVLGVKINPGAKLLADNPSVLSVKNNLRIISNGTLSPNPSTSTQPGDFVVSLGGTAAKLGKGGFVQADIRVPAGKIVVGRDTTVVGRLLALQILVNRRGTVARSGSCGDGTKQATEVCDTSAAGGDQLCPGDCIPLGQPGQCTCRCTTDADCDDHNACDGVEACDQGHCTTGTPPACDDGNACTIDCNPATGCVSVPAPDGTVCDDGDRCTRNDSCSAGVCKPGTPSTCNDGNDCTIDGCDPAQGCTHTPLDTGIACSDGNACTQADACIRGTCVSGSVANCDDGNACTVDGCSPTLGCLHQPVTNGVSCGGTGPCASANTCQAGVCVEQGPQPCGDGNPCTADTCTVVAGTAQCGHVAVPNFTPCGGTKTCFNGVCL